MTVDKALGGTNMNLQEEEERKVFHFDLKGKMSKVTSSEVNRTSRYFSVGEKISIEDICQGMAFN